MSTGDQSDMQARLVRQLPRGWFPDDAPNLAALLSGFATAWAAMFSLNQFVRAQQRISTATGIFADIAILDYFSLSRMRRKSNETDAALTARARAALLRPRGTRASLVAVLTDLTGTAPRVFYPASPTDAGGYSSLANPHWTGRAYGRVGRYGSLAYGYQAFVSVTRKVGGGVAGVSGYGSGAGGYGLGAIKYASLAEVVGQVTDADIYAAAADQAPIGTILWTRIGAP